MQYFLRPVVEIVAGDDDHTPPHPVEGLTALQIM
jgi:hypothetical protein